MSDANWKARAETAEAALQALQLQQEDSGDIPILPVSASNGRTGSVPSAAVDFDTLRYAQEIATAAARHYGPPEGWRPVNDLYGVLMQIDNALTGLCARALSPAQEGTDQ